MAITDFLKKNKSKILDLLTSGAEGYAVGVKSDFPEEGLAKGIVAGRESTRTNAAKRDYEGSDEFKGLTARERAQYNLDPDEFFKKERTHTTKIPTKLIDPSASEGDYTELPTGDAARVIMAAHKKPAESRPLEGDQLLSEVATREIYKRLKKTPEEIAAMPKQISARDARYIEPRTAGFDLNSFMNGGNEDAQAPEAETPPAEEAGFFSRLFGTNKQGTKLSEDEAKEILDLVGGDVKKAEIIAKKMGRTF